MPQWVAINIHRKGKAKKKIRTEINIYVSHQKEWKKTEKKKLNRRRKKWLWIKRKLKKKIGLMSCSCMRIQIGNRFHLYLTFFLKKTTTTKNSPHFFLVSASESVLVHWRNKKNRTNNKARQTQKAYVSNSSTLDYIWLYNTKIIILIIRKKCRQGFLRTLTKQKKFIVHLLVLCTYRFKQKKTRMHIVDFFILAP